MEKKAINTDTRLIIDKIANTIVQQYIDMVTNKLREEKLANNDFYQVINLISKETLFRGI